jgi:XTP/dITP diphosphohydrolase
MKEKILIASKNIDKIREIKNILNLDLLSLLEMKEVAEIEETGETFAENALIKARYYSQHYQIPVIADDSGLVVPALNGEPGIFSARYAGENTGSSKNNMKLLTAMKKLKESSREAFFICHAVYYNNGMLIEAEGKIKGIIIEKPRGTNGFGYDPLFFVAEIGKTFAQLNLSEKNKISHRFIAFNRLKEKLNKYLLSYE